MKKLPLTLFILIMLQKQAVATNSLDYEQQKTTNTQHVLAPRQYWQSCLESINPQYNADPDNRPDKFLELIEGFNNRLPDQYPFMPGFHVYYNFPNGKVWILGRRNTGEPGLQAIVKLFDAEQNRTNIIVKGRESNFSFAYTQNSTREKRKHPPLNFTIPRSLQPFRQSNEQMQEGHGGDQADSRDGMGYDPLNFMGQFKHYNEKIRNHLVRYQIREKGGGAYGEYAIAAHKPPLTLGGTFIPEAYLFLKYSKDRWGNNQREYFLFPNFPNVYYDSIKQALPRDRRSDYLKYMDLFRIDLGNYINLSPFVYSDQVTDEEIKNKVEQNFSIANAVASGKLHLIPLERQRFYPPSVVQAFNYRIALYLYEQAASIEMFSIYHKISLVERFIEDVPPTEREINFFQPNLARFWLNISEDQVKNTCTSLEDKLHLFRFHTSSHQLIEGEEIRNLQNGNKAEEVYEQIFHQTIDESSFEEDADNLMQLVDKIRENAGAQLAAMFFQFLTNTLGEVYSSYGLDEPSMYGFYSVDDIDDTFTQEWLELDEGDKELIDFLLEAKKEVLDFTLGDHEPTEQEINEAFRNLQITKDNFFTTRAYE